MDIIQRHFQLQFENFLFLVVLLFALLIGVPWRPDFFSTGLDSSWQIAMHHFFSTKRNMGTEVIFTSGPYGFLFNWFYYPATYSKQIFAYSLLTFFVSDSLWHLLLKPLKISLRLAIFIAIWVLAKPAWDVFFYTLILICLMILNSSSEKSGSI